MSLSDSESSSHCGKYKFFRQISRERLLLEMLGSTRTGDSRSTWKVFILDKVTVKVMSHTCKILDITDQGVSLVEDLFKGREPLPSMDAIYFIQPSKENVVMFLSDMSGREPLYKNSSVPKELVNHIKCDTSVLPRIGALRELAGKVNKIIRDIGLRELGQLEQDLVFGDAGAKDVINFLRTNQDASPENKLRLLMIYGSVYPEKFEGDKASKLMQLAKLSEQDMVAVNNMRLLAGSSATKKTTGGFSLKFDNKKTKQASRKDRTDEEE